MSDPIVAPHVNSSKPRSRAERLGPHELLRRSRSSWRRWFHHRQPEHEPVDAASDNESYRIPTDLRVTPTPDLRVLLVGQCLMGWLPFKMRAWDLPHEVDHLEFNNFSELPDEPPQPIDDYSFQIVQLPLRQLMLEQTYFQLPYDDADAWEQFLDQTTARMIRRLDSAMRYNKSDGLLTFVTNFFTPQSNPMGLLMPRNDNRNLVQFVSILNRRLNNQVARFRNAYVLDVDQIAGTFGRKYVQDDVLMPVAHGAVLGSDPAQEQLLEGQRIVPPAPLRRHYMHHEHLFHRAVWNECEAMFRVIRGMDAVKLVICDLDDTLWRGVVAEEDAISTDTTEGWPLGIAEALTFLKRRGILLAIVSKNDEATVTRLWDSIFHGRLLLSDFAVRKINWLPKSENIDAILRDVNVLPSSVVFIDDHPAERASVSARFPEIRVIGQDLYFLRRILLWSPETQVPAVTEESSERTEMVRAQVDRERFRETVPREQFLAELAVRARSCPIRDVSDGRFARSLELINKTNQFNTTGRRWTEEEAARHFGSGGTFLALEVEDKFTRYGTVVVAIVHEERQTLVVDQVVMSCRVIGLEVEELVWNELLRQAALVGSHSLRGHVVRGQRNHLSWDLFEKWGFSAVGEGTWESPARRLSSSESGR